jgi:hypothetical protein
MTHHNNYYLALQTKGQHIKLRNYMQEAQQNNPTKNELSEPIS